MALPRQLSLLPAVALVVANMVGVGLFTTTGYLSDLLGSSWLVITVWVTGALLAFCGAAIYAELGSMMPQSGGEYIYLSKAFHPSLGFASGWISLFVGFSAPIALSSFGFGAYVSEVFPGLPERGCGAALLVFLTAAHLMSGNAEQGVVTALTCIKSFLIAGFFLAALFAGEGSLSNLSAGSPQYSIEATASALILVSYSYSGWNVAAYVAGEIKHPGRNIARALLIGTSLAVVITLGVNFAYLYALPPTILSGTGQRVAAVAAEALLGAHGAALVSMVIALALASSVSGMIMAGPRVYAKMAEDDVFFPILARRDRRGLPWVSIIFQSAISLIMLYSWTFLALLTYVGFTLWLVSIATVLSLHVLRRTERRRKSAFSFAWPYTGILFVGLSSAVVLYAVVTKPVLALTGGGTILAGVLFYFVRRLLVCTTK